MGLESNEGIFTLSLSPQPLSGFSVQIYVGVQLSGQSLGYICDNMRQTQDNVTNSQDSEGQPS